MGPRVEMRVFFLGVVHKKFPPQAKRFSTSSKFVFGCLTILRQQCTLATTISHRCFGPNRAETMIEARRTSVPPSAEQELPGRKGPPPKLEPFPVVVFCWVVREHLPDCHICGALSLAKSLCLAIFAGIRVFLEMQPWMFHSIHGCLFFPNRKEQLL